MEEFTLEDLKIFNTTLNFILIKEKEKAKRRKRIRQKNKRKLNGRNTKSHDSRN